MRTTTSLLDRRPVAGRMRPIARAGRRSGRHRRISPGTRPYGSCPGSEITIIRSRPRTPRRSATSTRASILSSASTTRKRRAPSQRAAELDPNAPMPHWGIAWALGPNYNLDVDDERAKQANGAIASAAVAVEREIRGRARVHRSHGDSLPERRQARSRGAGAPGTRTRCGISHADIQTISTPPPSTRRA